MMRLAPLLLVAAPAWAEPAVAPLDPTLEPLREASPCPSVGMDVPGALRIVQVAGIEALRADQELRAAQARLCARKASEDG